MYLSHEDEWCTFGNIQIFEGTMNRVLSYFVFVKQLLGSVKHNRYQSNIIVIILR